jgi:hypothetical protein
MNRFLAVVATWLMVLVTLAQGGPGGPGGGGQPTLSLVASQTDWLGNEDATDRVSFPALLPAVEGFTHTLVYPRGGVAQVKLFFQNNNPIQEFTGQLIVVDARFKHNTAPLATPWGSPAPPAIPDTLLSAGTATLNVGIGQTAAATLSISGLPAFVTKGYIELSLRAEGNFGAQTPGSNPSPWSGTLPTQTVLITFAPPTGVMEPVWVELASMSCAMAQLADTIGEVNQSLVRGLFNSSLFFYDLPSGPANYTTLSSIYNFYGPKTVKFNLKGLLLAHYSNSGPLAAGCSDVNSFSVLLHQAQGIPASGRVVTCEVAEQAVLFACNEVAPIGSDETHLPNYLQPVFAWHFQTDVQGDISDSVVAYRYDLAGQAFLNPASNWGYDGSWQTFIGSGVFGLAYRRVLENIDTETPQNSGWWLLGSSPGQPEDALFQTYLLVEVY